MNNVERPYVICHMMSTIDGKIASGKDGVDILGDYFSLYTEVEDKLGGRAWMCGRVTMQMFANGVSTALPPVNKEIPSSDFIAEFETDAFMFAVDTKGLLRWDTNRITLSNVSDKLHLIVIVTHATPKEYLGYLQEKGISYIFGGSSELNFENVLNTMKETFGIKKLLLEGGGGLNGSVMSAGLVDEISLIMCPLVLNRSNAPTSFDRKTETFGITNYTLFDVQKLEKDTVWLRYKKINQ